MKINFVTQRYYPNIQFGQFNARKRAEDSRSSYPDLGEAIREINHDYDVRSQVLSEISDDVKLSPMAKSKHQHRLQAHRDYMIAQLVGEDYDGSEAEDFIERMTY